MKVRGAATGLVLARGRLGGVGKLDTSVDEFILSDELEILGVVMGGLELGEQLSDKSNAHS